MYYLVSELCRDLSGLLQRTVYPVQTNVDISGTWMSLLFRQPDRADGTFSFKDGTATRSADGGRKLYQCIYTIPEPGILRLCDSHADAAGNWMSHGSREVFFAYHLDQDTIVFSNEDTSVVRVLSKIDDRPQ